MSRIVTVIAIFLVVISLAVCESVYTINVSEQVKGELQSAVEAYNKNDKEKAMKSIKKADEIWEDNTSFLDVFLVHNNVEEIAQKIISAEQTLKYDDEYFPIECEGAIASLKIMIYSMLPYFDNIL